MPATVIAFKKDKRFNSKLHLFLLGVLICLIAVMCGGKKEVPVTGQSKILAVYKDSFGAKHLDVLIRIIKVETVYDSSQMKYKVSFDTTWGVTKMFPILDSATQKQKTDSLGNKMFQSVWVRLDSDKHPNWHIENRDVDSLLKK